MNVPNFNKMMEMIKTADRALGIGPASAELERFISHLMSDMPEENNPDNSGLSFGVRRFDNANWRVLCADWSHFGSSESAHRLLTAAARIVALGRQSSNGSGRTTRSAATPTVYIHLQSMVDRITETATKAMNEQVR